VKFRRLAAVLLAWSLVALHAPAASRYMPLSEITPGMVGIGRTVFLGTTIEEFKAHILGVLTSNVGPQRDLILARLEGGPLAKTGVIAGMSGSPVYIDGRLIGAVSYSLGAFPTEAIAGITPIGEMMQATIPPPASTAVRRPFAPIAIGADASELVRAFQEAVAAPGAFGPSVSPSLRLDSRTSVEALGTALRPIAVPLSIGGLDLAVAEPALRVLRQAGFVATPGGRMPLDQQAADAPPLRPGDPIGVSLISGDLEFGATGTVTEVADGRVYAFGHPLYNVGPARYAMTRAYVHAVLPSLSSSMKIASMGAVIGTIQQDRSTAVAGMLGPGPDLLALTVSLQRDGGTARTFRFNVVDDPLLTPLLVYTALANIFSSHEKDFGPSTYAIRGRVAVASHGAVEIDDVFAGDQPGFIAAGAVANPIGALLTNDRERVRISTVDLEIASSERLRMATIERVWIDAADVRRGATVPLKILLKTWRGEDLVQTVPVEIPRSADGPLTLIVADGARLTQYEQSVGRVFSTPGSVDQMVKVLNQARRSNRLYVRLVSRDMGAVVNGESMPALPSSVLAVMQGDRAGGSTPSMQTATMGSWDIPLGQAVMGMRTLSITLAPSSPRP
jgi:hypothetical protein